MFYISGVVCSGPQRATQKEFETKVKEWFRQAKARRVKKKGIVGNSNPLGE
jgi:hypothetical protein